ncbi:MAG: TorF family putative porin [Gammaproteobacteria bacterium]|nr:TorF family putative porin [Gammaproteobacteria bacterium]MDH5304696.1 TorF family putative porin [Gammaproteobacteria bacterium]MDH5322880.1 TorF family putative porin [Gammaproteobacteria bacterium]
MNTYLKTGLLSSLLAMTGIAQADWSANLGYASEYHYRGILQKESSANGGIDFETGGFYLGSWAADVGDGLEVDVYGGYGTDVGAVSLSVGFTGYYYTGDFDDTYEEINLGAGLGGLSLDVAVGQYDNFDGPTEDYTYYALTYEKSGFYGKYAGFTQDFDGEYFEFGYGTTIAEIDLGVSLILANDDLVGDAEESIVFTIGKSFDL